MIFSNLTLNLVKIGRNLRKKLRFDFFVPINFERDIIYKIGATFEFLAKTSLVSDLFLKGFLYILRFSEISFSFQFGTKT